MKSKIKKLNGTGREILVEMPKEAVDNAIEAVLQEIRKTANIPGFRKGNAPIDMIRKDYMDDAVDEVKKKLIPEAYQAALDKHEVRPVSYPEISDVAINAEGLLVFKAIVDSHPDVSVKKYRGLKVKSEKVNVDAKEVDETLKSLVNMNAEFIDIDEEIKKGDFAICDVCTFIEDKEIAKKRENMWVEADKEASLLGMGEELVGLKKGASKDIEVTLPENYPDKKYAGQKALFKVEVKETKEKKLPELNDELAKKMGKESMTEVRDEIKGQLLERKEQNNKAEMKNQIMEQLLSKSSFDLPEAMVERQLKVLMDKAESDLASKGIEKEALDAHKDKLKEQLMKEAENKVKLYFILDKIADEEKVDVTEEEINAWLQAMAANYNQPFENVKKYYEEHDLLGGLIEQLREDKTLDLLVEESSTTN